MTSHCSSAIGWTLAIFQGGLLLLVCGCDQRLHLGFSVGPPLAIASRAMDPAVVVELEYADGSRARRDGLAITIALRADSGAGQLAGTLTAKLVDGSATFPDLTVDDVGRYHLVASAPGAMPAESGAFDVRPTWLRSPQDTVTSLAIDPKTPSTIYAATATRGYRSGDGGATWADMHGWIDGDLIGVDPLNGQLWYTGYYHHGTVAATPDFAVMYHSAVESDLFGSRGGMARSTDHGVTWTTVAHLGAIDPCQALLVDPRTPNTVLCAIDSSGARAVHRSLDGGASWQTVMQGLPGSAPFSISFDARGTAWLSYPSSSGNQLFTLAEGGAAWTAFSAAGLPPKNRMTAPVFDPNDASTLYLADGDKIYRSADGGRSFAALPQPAGALVVALDPVSSTRLYAGVHDLGVAVSSDGGATFTTQTAGLASGGFQAATGSGDLVVAAWGHDLFLGTLARASGDATLPLFTSLAGTASTFGPIYAGSASGLYVSANQAGTFSLTAWHDPVSLIAGDGANVWVANGASFGRSADGGATFTTSTLAFVPRAFAFARAANALYATASDGLYRSLDGGQSFTRLTGCGSMLASDVRAVAAPDAATLYVSAGARLFVSKDGGDTCSEGGAVDGMAIDAVSATSDGKVFASTVGSLRLSTDRGASFRRFDSGIPAGAAAARVFLSPLAAPTAYANGVLYRLN